MQTLTMTGVKTIRVARLSLAGKCVILQIEADNGDMEIGLYGLDEEQRLHLCRVLSDSVSKVRTATDYVPMSEWLVENDVHTQMGVKGDD